MKPTYAELEHAVHLLCAAVSSAENWISGGGPYDIAMHQLSKTKNEVLEIIGETHES